MSSTANHGETDLNTILATLSPVLLPSLYVFCTLKDTGYGTLAHTKPLASIDEPEGLTLVLTKASADSEGLSYQGTFRCIRLEVHSSLEAVGLTAVVAAELAAHEMSANMIAGYHHDHVLVPAASADLAMRRLQNMGPASVAG